MRYFKVKGEALNLLCLNPVSFRAEYFPKLLNYNDQSSLNQGGFGHFGVDEETYERQ